MVLEDSIEGTWKSLGKMLFGHPIYYNVDDPNAKVVYNVEEDRIILKYKVAKSKTMERK